MEAQGPFSIAYKGARFELPPPITDARSVFAFSTNRAGSSLLNAIMRAIAEPAGLVYYALSKEAVRQGVRANSLPEQFAGMIRPRGYLYGGFRAAPSFTIENIETYPSVLLIRDPRDIIVSLYYSRSVSHGVPGPGEARENFDKNRSIALGMSIDEFVVHEAPNRCRKIRSLNPVSEFSRIYRYEDVIYSKKSWIEGMVRYLQIDVGDDAIESIAKSVDIVPESEDPSHHIRQVAPGDHRHKLRPETIDCLNHEFADIMERYGYLP